MTTPAAVRDGTRDFDFFYGKWHSHNHRLVGRLENSTTWEDFDANAECWPLDGGLGNMDYLRTDFWPGFIGMSLRTYDPATGIWRIYWTDNRNFGPLIPPVAGSFNYEGIGIFECEDTLRGMPIIVRYTWSDITPTSAKWAQSFSPDNGKTWELNWTTTHTRMG